MKLLLLMVLVFLSGCIEPPPEASSDNNEPQNNEPTNVVTSNNSTTPNNILPPNNVVTSNNLPNQTVIGNSCERVEDCGIGVCVLESEVGIPKGYCSLRCIESTECGLGAHCGIKDNKDNSGGLCLRTCQESSECGRPGFGCFDLDLDGNKECWSVGTGPGLIGDPCNSVAECSGGEGAFCQTQTQGFKSGYCTKFCAQGVVPDICGTDSHCTVFGMCARNECQRDDGYISRDLDADGRDECWPAATGGNEVGEQCEGLWDCKGEALGFCLTDVPDGYCTQICSSSTPCPSGSKCFQGEQGSVCLASCDGVTPCSGTLQCQDLPESPGGPLISVCWLSTAP